MSDAIASIRLPHRPRVDVYPWLRDLFTNRLDQAARIEELDGTVTLASRHVEGGEWHPTWVGPKERAVRVPDGFQLPERYVALIEEALAAGSSAAAPPGREQDGDE